jgi:hypothetical protein
MMTFKELNISKPILKALKNKGYETLAPIQEQAISAILGGRDLERGERCMNAVRLALAEADTKD